MGLRRRRGFGLRAVAPAACAGLALLAAEGARAAAASDCDGTVSGRQGVSGFSLLVDGQPGGPGQPQLGVTGSISKGTEQLGAALSYTPKGACDTLLTLATPGLTMTGHRGGIERNIDLAWLQRWRADDARGPTFSTLVDLEVPIDSPGQRAQATLVAILARSFSKGTAYLNLTAESPAGGGSRDWTVGALVGWRHDLSDKASLIFDVGVQPGGVPTVETALQYAIGSNLSIGPGVSWSIGEGDEEITFGITLQRAFGGGQ